MFRELGVLCVCVHLASVLHFVGIKMVSGDSCLCLTLACVGMVQLFPTSVARYPNIMILRGFAKIFFSNNARLLWKWVGGSHSEFGGGGIVPK